MVPRFLPESDTHSCALSPFIFNKLTFGTILFVKKSLRVASTWSGYQPLTRQPTDLRRPSTGNNSNTSKASSDWYNLFWHQRRIHVGGDLRWRCHVSPWLVCLRHLPSSVLVTSPAFLIVRL